ncbi:hypothetical protein GW17_00021472 [Ensete ventricosum]|nr:hypothetical protein GW17_00021472 [Ensete ventricosum]
MGKGHSHHGLGYDQLSLHHHQQRPQKRSLNDWVRGGSVGEIVDVHAGHIVRSTGRKDRHSKVCTAKGLRDRRVRLSAHTAIQFYDVQDRLGCDRPSKAVDWLITNAKAAIDKLAELPPCIPSASDLTAPHTASSSCRPPPSAQFPSTEQNMTEFSEEPFAVAAPLLNSETLADVIKFFCPMVASATAAPFATPSIRLDSYLSDLPSRTCSQAQDLRLSLQSFQDPVFRTLESGHHHHHHAQYLRSPNAPTPDAHFLSSADLAFNAASVSTGLAEQNQRTVPWNVVESSGGGGEEAFSSAVPLHSVLGQSELFFQRGPLQSGNSPVVHAGEDTVDAGTDHLVQTKVRPCTSPIGFTSVASFSGFHIPARIPGEEKHDCITDKPPSAPHH